MHAYTVEPLYVKSGQEVMPQIFYRPKLWKNRLLF